MLWEHRCQPARPVQPFLNGCKGNEEEAITRQLNRHIPLHTNHKQQKMKELLAYGDVSLRINFRSMNILLWKGITDYAEGGKKNSSKSGSNTTIVMKEKQKQVIRQAYVALCASL